MKKIFLLLAAFAFSLVAIAQKPYDIDEAKRVAESDGAPGLVSTYRGQRVYFDPENSNYLMQEPFKRKYGLKTLNQLDNIYKRQINKLPEPEYIGIKSYDIAEAKSVADSKGAPGLVSAYKGQRVYFDPEDSNYLISEHFARKYGVNTMDQLDAMYESYSMRVSLSPFTEEERQQQFLKHKAYRAAGYNTDPYGNPFKWRLKPLNTIIGSSLIGASAASYMLSNSIISNKEKNYAKDFADGKLELDEYNDQIESLDGTKRTMGYICAGVSVAGIIVVLSGLHREYAEGVNLGHNFIIQDNGAGLSLTKKF